MGEYKIRPLNPGEELTVCSMIRKVFSQFVAPSCSPEGVSEFYAHAEPMAMSHRNNEGSLFLVAVSSDNLVGIIEVRDNRHISLLFVDPAYHQQGIAKSLISEAQYICLQRDPALTQITVKSSPYAAMIYQRMGFEPTGPEEEQNGIRFHPHAKTL